jgi:hypothetical protein
MPTKPQLVKRVAELEREVGSHVDPNAGVAAAQAAMVDSREYGDGIRRDSIASNQARRDVAQEALRLSGQDLAVTPSAGAPMTGQVTVESNDAKAAAAAAAAEEAEE